MQYHEHVKENGTIVNVPHPITYQSSTFQASQKKWSAFTKEAYVNLIYMMFHKMIFYLKVAHIKIKCDHAPLCRFIYSVTKNVEVYNWSQEIHASIPYMDCEHIEETISLQTTFQD